MEKTPLVNKAKESDDNSSSQPTPFYLRRKFLQRWIIALIVSLAIIVFLTSKFFNNLFNKHDKDTINDIDESYRSLLGNNPFSEYSVCEDETNPPSLNNYHIHAVWDGSNVHTSQSALLKFYQFKNYINPNMDECPFSHNNAGLDQTEICYFPFYFDETESIISSHKLWNQAQYAFFVPKNYMEIALSWWTQNRNDKYESFSIAIHPAIGCQQMSHSKWLISSNDLNNDFNFENLPCCTTGPAKCSCDLISLQDKQTGKCLGLKYNTNSNDISNALTFKLTDCQEYSMVQQTQVSIDNEYNTGIYSVFWRETFYDEDKNWIQLENYGPFDYHVPKQAYLCMTVDVNDDNNNIVMNDCSVNQDTNADKWIADISMFTYDNELEMIKYLGTNDNNKQLCLNVNTIDDINNNNVDETSTDVKIKLSSCSYATKFTRVFYP